MLEWGAIAFSVISNCLQFFPSSILDTFQPGGLTFLISFCLFILVMGFLGQEYWNGLPFPPPVNHTMFYQNYLLWPTLLGWGCTACFIASLSYGSPFTMTTFWSTKGYYNLCNTIVSKLYEEIKFKRPGKTLWNYLIQLTIVYC